MNDDLKIYILVPFFAAVGGVATGLVWLAFSLTILPAVADRYTVLACVLVGLLGPVLVWFLVWGWSRRVARNRRAGILRPASIGLGLATATELAFYVPIGFLTVAFYSQTL